MNKDERVQSTLRKLPSWQVSLIPFVVLTLSLVVVIKIFGPDALLGGSQVCLLLASAVTAAISMFIYKASWNRLELCILDNIRSVGSAILILFLIGAIAGTWMVGGIVPALICYGLEIIYPAVFLAAACVISALVSVMTGSSWTTIATIGVALIGIGIAQGFDPGWTAGAIVSGAYFGDKVSPLSDTTVLASSSSGTPLFTHIRYMMITTIPSLTIALIVFLVASLMHPSVEASQTDGFAEALRDTFHINPVVAARPRAYGCADSQESTRHPYAFLCGGDGGRCSPYLPASGGMGGGEPRLARFGIRRTFVLGRLQRDCRDVLRLYRHPDGQRRYRFADFHAGHDRDAQYGVPHHLLGDVRRCVGRERHVAEPHRSVRAVGASGGYAGRGYRRDGIYV